jgi:4-nitrophenyl phosphatase
VTNNSTLSSKDYLAKFTKLGIHATQEEVFGSSRATAFYLKNIVQFPTDKRVYVIGQSGVFDELTLQGIESFGGVLFVGGVTRVGRHSGHRLARVAQFRS